jgi:hypothetical protein
MWPDFDEPNVTRDEDEQFVGIPGFLSGGRVEQTGIALVHEGEYIMPAPGSEAVISPGVEGVPDGQVINYYFPVEIEIIGDLNETQLRRVAQYVFDELETALRSQI